MKVRGGFVSNSSSSSFLICLRKDPAGQNESIFEYVLELAATCNQKILSRPVGHERKQLQEELVKLRRDAAFQDGQVKALESFAADKLFRKKLKALDEALSLVGSSIHWKVKDQVRQHRNYANSTDYAWQADMDPVGEALDRAKRALLELTPEISAAEQKLIQLTEFSDDQVLYSFEEDHSFGAGIKRAVLKMVEDGKAVIVERIDT